MKIDLDGESLAFKNGLVKLSSFIAYSSSKNTDGITIHFSVFRVRMKVQCNCSMGKNIFLISGLMILWLIFPRGQGIPPDQ